MDIEGAEKAVLRDAAAWLPKVRMLIIELHGDYSEADLRSDIEPFGFHVSKGMTQDIWNQRAFFLPCRLCARSGLAMSTRPWRSSPNGLVRQSAIFSRSGIGVAGI